MQTALSLASSLNFEYLTHFKETAKESNYRGPLVELIKHSKIRNILEKIGYKIVSFETGLYDTSIEDSDIYFRNYIDINDFEKLIITSSIIYAFENHLKDIIPFQTYKTHRLRTTTVFNNLERVPEISGLKFVFVHLLIPHPPFVFNSTGKSMNPDYTFRLADGSGFPGTEVEYIIGYRDQIRYLNSLIINLVDHIKLKSEKDPIIIIQGDHGPGAYLDWESIENSILPERFGIINAYYFPNGGEGMLYPSITPVNSFRIVLNVYFNHQFELLEDKNFFSTWARPYDFTETTDLLQK
jgi:hypothetical protein